MSQKRSSIYLLAIIDNGAGRVIIDGNPLPQAPRRIVNASARHQWQLADGQLYVLTDWSHRRITGAIDFNNLTGFINEPRTVGVQFKGNF